MASISQNRERITVNLNGGTATIKGYKCGLPPMTISQPCVITGHMDADNWEPILERVRGEAEERHLTAKPKYEIGDLVQWQGGHFLVVGYNQQDNDQLWCDEYRMLAPVTGSVVEFSIRFIDSQASLAE